MAQLASTLKEAADKNNELLAELRQTDYAPSSLEQNSSYIEDLRAQISTTDQELEKLHAITEDERKDHVRYRDSNFKRYVHKIGGSKGKDKFTSKQEKEEKDFLDAWQKERSAKEGRDELSRALQQAESDRFNLETDSQRHTRAQTELDKLYNSIFSGPTPDVPGEDALERAVQQSREIFNYTNNQLTTDHQILEILKKADQSLHQAESSISDALRRSQRDMFLGGGTFTDMMERDALAQAQNSINATQRHMQEAQRLSSSSTTNTTNTNSGYIHPLSEISIDHGHFFSDVLFDNIFSDMAQHDRIKQSEAQLGAAVQDLQGQIQGQYQRIKATERKLEQTRKELEGARKELQRVRGEAFERVAGGALPPPPS